MSLVNRETDYAVRILRCLLDGKSKTVAAISKEQNFAKSFAHKIVKKLSNAGFLSITKGPGGGVSLCCNIKEKSLYDLMFAVDNIQYVNDCFKPGYECEFNDCENCKAHKTFRTWQEHLDHQLKSINLETII